MADAATVDIAALWRLVQEGGVGFLLFLALAMFFTGRVLTARERDQLVKSWETRYKENDDRWKERFEEKRQEAEQLRQMLYQQMGYQSRVVAVAERAARVTEVVTGVAPAPPQSG